MNNLTQRVCIVGNPQCFSWCVVLRPNNSQPSTMEQSMNLLKNFQSHPTRTTDTPRKMENSPDCILMASLTATIEICQKIDLSSMPMGNHWYGNENGSIIQRIRIADRNGLLVKNTHAGFLPQKRRRQDTPCPVMGHNLFQPNNQ